MPVCQWGPHQQNSIELCFWYVVSREYINASAGIVILT